MEGAVWWWCTAAVLVVLIEREGGIQLKLTKTHRQTFPFQIPSFLRLLYRLMTELRTNAIPPSFSVFRLYHFVYGLTVLQRRTFFRLCLRLSRGIFLYHFLLKTSFVLFSPPRRSNMSEPSYFFLFTKTTTPLGRLNRDSLSLYCAWFHIVVWKSRVVRVMYFKHFSLPCYKFLVISFRHNPRFTSILFGCRSYKTYFYWSHFNV